MKNLKTFIGTIILSSFVGVGMTSCGDYLDIIPENNLAVDNFWASKADVESALNSGYYYLRSSVEGNLIPWGEQRAGVIYGNSVGVSSLQKFQLKPSAGICSWAPMYKIINQANLVLANAVKAQDKDRTYTNSEVNSHYCEAYFLRALAYFYIVRNWREAPIVTIPYETDETTLQIAKSSEAALIAQIKSDLQAAMRLDAAKTEWDTTWETKGKATKWAIYALMADVCLWNQDFNDAITYADLILNDKTGKAPHLITAPKTHAGWFSIFNPGNSEESIFEVQWNQEKNDGTSKQQNNLFNLFYSSDGKCYQMSQAAFQQFQSEYDYQRTAHGVQVMMYPENACRTLNGSYLQSGNNIFVWKYIGGSTQTEMRTAAAYDPNFIIYRVAELMLIKAEALIMRANGTSEADNAAALELINKIRERSNCEKYDDAVASSTLSVMMDYLMKERVLELIAEGKAWYDFVRVSRYPDSEGFTAKDFALQRILSYSASNGQARESWIKSVLLNDDAWFLPVAESEIKVNNALVQNRYYQ